MDYSKSGLALTESFESCRLTSYQDVRGVWTIGWGSTGPSIGPNLTWTQDQCDSQLVLDLTKAEHAVNTLVTVPLTQGQYDSLVDFCYNCGIGAFSGSTMLKLLNAGQYDDAANEFQKWSHASGKVVAGLLRRRLSEQEEFNS
jgi:lysozyme